MNRERVTESFEMIKKLSMERANIINYGNQDISAISLLFSAFIQMFIDKHPCEKRMSLLNSFFEEGKKTIQESIDNDRQN